MREEGEGGEEWRKREEKSDEKGELLYCCHPPQKPEGISFTNINANGLNKILVKRTLQPRNIIIPQQTTTVESNHSGLIHQQET